MKNCYVLKPDPNNSYKGGIADLTEIGEMVPGTMTLTRINVPEEFRGLGWGSRLLKMILADADKAGVALSLEIMPSGPLDHDALRQWYRRNGFRDSTKYVGAMIRRPRQCHPSTFGHITPTGVEYGFRCAKHGLAYSEAFHTRAELHRGILSHWRATVVKKV